MKVVVMALEEKFPIRSEEVDEGKLGPSLKSNRAVILFTWFWKIGCVA